MEDQASIGENLRRRREERSLSVQEASAQSKVPLRLLQALESDDYRLLPDPLYLIRFLHDYARFLGLDAEAMELEFQRAVRRPPRVPLTATSTAPAPPSIPWKQLVWTGAALLVVTPLVFIALSLASKRAAERTPVPATPEPASMQVQAGARPAAGTGPVAAPGIASAPSPHIPGMSLSALDVQPPPSSLSGAPPAGAAAPAAPPAAGQGGPAGKQVLVARAHEQTWMVVRVDGGEPREVLLQAGQVARFTADAGFLVTLGNAGGVALALNGAAVPSLGRSGQVVRDLRLPQVASAPPGQAAAQPER